MKLQEAGTVNRLNVEHRMPNIERPIVMTLRFIYFKTNESRWRRDLKTAACDEPFGREPFGRMTQGRTTKPNRISKGRFAPGLHSHFGGAGLLSIYLNWQNTVFDVGRSMFDVRRSLVSFSIRPAVFFGRRLGWNLTPETFIFLTARDHIISLESLNQSVVQ